jgi:mRNA interferase MazF
MNRGEVWWVDLPSPVGRRPVLILTRDAAVAVRNQVVVAQVTTTRHGLACEVELTRADGMPQDCVVNCDVLLAVEKRRFRRRITALSAARLPQVYDALRFALELP